MSVTRIQNRKKKAEDMEPAAWIARFDGEVMVVLEDGVWGGGTRRGRQDAGHPGAGLRTSRCQRESG